jgi:hypothetical protein
VSTLKRKLEKKRHISRILITGTGRGAAVASIFTLRHGREILSWPSSPFDSDFEDSQQQTMELICLTFGCPRFMCASTVALVDPVISSRIVHLYGEHQLVPLSLTSLDDSVGRVGRIVNIRDSVPSLL